jgi:hypothetical protein
MGTFDPTQLESMLGASAPADTSIPVQTGTFNPSALESKINAQPESVPAQKPMANAPAKWQMPKNQTGFSNELAAPVLSMASSIGAGIVNGWRGISALATGASLNDAIEAMKEPNLFGAGLRAEAYQPEAGSTGEKINQAMASPYNPLNYPADIGGYVGGKLADTGHPALAAVADVGAQFAIPVGVAKGFSMMKGVPKVPTSAYSETGLAANELPIKQATTVPATIPAEKVPVGQIAIPSVAEKYAPGQVTSEGTPVLANLIEQNDKTQVLNRIGLDTARKSAIEGNGLQAATESQIAKLNSPAGQIIKQQLDKENQALTNHAANIVESTGGTVGTDNSSLLNRGQTIAAPFDGLRDYFRTAKQNLYQEAEQRLGSTPIQSMPNLDNLLNDPSFKNSLLAQDKQNLLTGITNQLQEFKTNNPQGMTVSTAEDFRKFLNSAWSPQNSAILGKIKGALDQDIFSSAGEDAFQAGRQLHILEKSTLSDPKGISKLFDVDPKTSINRTTPFENIPDKLVNLPTDQMQHITDTLKMMQSNPDIPPELQASAKQAQSEIAAQLANRLLQQGNRNMSGWSAKNVSSEIANNAGKYEQVMTPEQIGMINDLNQAGHILRMDKSYPGAAAQTENLLKAGTLPRIVKLASGVVNKVGPMVGDIVASKMAEKSAAKKVSSGLVSLKGMQP